MAICRICGKEDKKLPDSWKFWECLECFKDSFLGLNFADFGKDILRIVYEDLSNKARTVQNKVSDCEIEKVVRDYDV